MDNDNHIFTNDFRNLSRELGRRGVRNPGQVALKKMGVEKAVKKKFHDYYLDKQMQKP